MVIKSKPDISKIKSLAQKVKSEADLDNLRSELDSEISDIICNQCGNSCKTPMENYEGLIEVVASGGYESKTVPDDVSIKFSLCEDCLGALIKGFKHKPAQRDDNLASYDAPFVDQVLPEPTIMPQNENSSSKIIDLISKKAKK